MVTYPIHLSSTSRYKNVWSDGSGHQSISPVLPRKKPEVKSTFRGHQVQVPSSLDKIQWCQTVFLYFSFDRNVIGQKPHPLGREKFLFDDLLISMITTHENGLYENCGSLSGLTKAVYSLYPCSLVFEILGRGEGWG